MNDTIETINDSDDETMDPDWVKTPVQKLRRKTTVSIKFNCDYMNQIADFMKCRIF